MAKVLVVDDDQGICSMLARMITKPGHEFACVLTLSEGIVQASEGDYDVVFLDVGLPDGSGLDALPQFCGTESCPEVIITAQGVGSVHGRLGRILMKLNPESGPQTNESWIWGTSACS